MREIKFRAWDKDKKIFLPHNSFAVLTDHYAGALFVMVKDFENYREGEFGYQNDFELMQYTGLKDKNGKEIYSGDILKVHTHIKPLLVEWKGVETNKGMMFGYLIDLSAYGYNDGKGVEVIGNIYENPELLNKDR